jgi:hypothetical protein
MDKFTVELHTPDGRRLPTVVSGPEEWVVGEQGEEFTLTVSMTNTSQSDYKVRAWCLCGSEAGVAAAPPGAPSRRAEHAVSCYDTYTRHTTGVPQD